MRAHDMITLPPHVASLASGVRAEFPLLRAPLALLVDDPMPCFNPLYYHRKFFDGHARPHNRAGYPLVRTIPPDFLDRFCDVVRAGGARGKFSVVPNPFGLGEIDRSVRGCPRRQCRRFIETVRSRLSRDFDITPEMATHGHALDLDTGRRRAENEDVWSRRQGVNSLTRYLTYAAGILQRAGLQPDGFTSPWSFGSRVERHYAEAALRAQQAVNGRSLTWYFLATSDRRRVLPRLMVLRRASGQAVVHIVAGCPDLLWQTQDAARADAACLRAIVDSYLTSDGGGRLGELVASASFAVLLTHWQSLYSNGSEAGLAALAGVLARLKRTLGARITWMKCSEMARYYAAAKAASARAVDRGLAIRSPFACPAFTASIPAPRRPGVLTANGRQLRRVESPLRLRNGTWAWRAGRAYVCLDLPAGRDIVLDASPRKRGMRQRRREACGAGGRLARQPS